MAELRQICKSIPDVAERFFIDDEGNLYTDFGERRMSDNCLRGGYVRNDLAHKKGALKKRASYARHRLVMLCFKPIEDAEKMQVNHKDGNKLNNRLDNLEWCTNRENQLHAHKIGLCKDMKGEKNPFSKLDEEKVKIIIQRLLDNVYVEDICREFSISRSTVYSIRAHRNWKYLTEGILFPGQSSTTISKESTPKQVEMEGS